MKTSAEKIPADYYTQKLNENLYPNIIKLIKLGEIIIISNAEIERCFLF